MKYNITQQNILLAVIFILLAWISILLKQIHHEMKFNDKTTTTHALANDVNDIISSINYLHGRFDTLLTTINTINSDLSDLKNNIGIKKSQSVISGDYSQNSTTSMRAEISYIEDVVTKVNNRLSYLQSDIERIKSEVVSRHGNINPPIYSTLRDKIDSL